MFCRRQRDEGDAAAVPTARLFMGSVYLDR